MSLHLFKGFLHADQKENRLVNQYQENQSGFWELDEQGNPIPKKVTENVQESRFEFFALASYATYTIKNFKIHPATWDNRTPNLKPYNASPFHSPPAVSGFSDVWLDEGKNIVHSGGLVVAYKMVDMVTNWEQSKQTFHKVIEFANNTPMDSVTASISRMVGGTVAGMNGEQGENYQKYLRGQVAGFFSTFLLPSGSKGSSAAKKAAATTARNTFNQSVKKGSDIFGEMGDDLIHHITNRVKGEVKDEAFHLLEDSKKLMDEFSEVWSKASKEFKEALQKQPEFFDAWRQLKNFTEFSKNPKILESYAKVKRVGEYTDEVIPFKISDLTKAHGAPKKGQEFKIPRYEDIFSTTGYDLSKPIPVIKLPDGALLIADGHHRLKALENLKQEIVPVKLLTYEKAIDQYGEEGLGVLVEVAKLSGNYKGKHVVKVIDTWGVKIRAKFFMDDFFPGWK